MNTEPSLDQMDDYNDNESPQKRKTIRMIFISLLVVGAVLAVLKYNFNHVDDYIGTQENPGINTAR